MTDLMTKRRAPLLDGRLSAAMALAENCRVFADIGADHGRLSAVMLLADENRRALVADISAPALQKSRDLLGRMQLTDRATFAVADMQISGEFNFVYCNEKIAEEKIALLF